ncbi:hypothetical protein [Krasilnikovia sp. MM14-A1259]|uniref:hypothetical protein n=1 Tax=Krasilnikovia sp. MM14-A1259 TaxID=3373539 RepID=UPI00380D0D85
MSRRERPGGRPAALPVARMLARALAQARDGVLRPEDDAGAAAALATLEEAGRLLTTPSWHQVRAHLLHELADTALPQLDLRDPDRIQVALWLRERALDEEHAAAHAASTTGAAPAAA